MMCYRDMTFCSFYNKCMKGMNCDMALTCKVQQYADKIKLPICIFADQPDCFEEVKK